MCGIAGILNGGVGGEFRARRMVARLTHRGPDDEGCVSNGAISLAQARLSIIDLVTGHQPLCNEDGTVWVTFNGEIYNYQELRQELRARGHAFRTESDTEVLVHAYEEYDVDFVRRLRGMFA